MNIRKHSVTGMLVGLLAIGGLALAGSPLAGGAFLVLLACFAVLHAVLLCSRCENDCCALNSTSSDFLFGDPRPRTEVLEPGDNRWVPVALAITLPFGLWGAWQFNPVGLVASLALVAVSFVGYRRKTCTYCPEPCPLAPRKV